MGELLKPNSQEAFVSFDRFPREFNIEKIYSGKVCEVFKMENGLLVFVNTDRISAWDQKITAIPDKGEMRTKLTKYWGERTIHIAPNYIVAVPDPNVIIGKPGIGLGIELVYRRHFKKGVTKTSIGGMYENGTLEQIYGITLRPGYKHGDELDEGTILTPTTKSQEGPDRTLTEEQITGGIDEGMLHPTAFKYFKEKGIEMFNFVYDECRKKGILLIDGKLEGFIGEDDVKFFGDEFFTLDSSGQWLAEGYDERKGPNGWEPVVLDKEWFRKTVVERTGYKGQEEIPVPTIPDDIIQETRRRYLLAFETITGEKLESVPGENKQERIIRNMGKYIGIDY